MNEKCQQQNITSKILIDEEPTDSRITSNTGNDQSSGSIDPLDPQPVGFLLKMFQGTIENGWQVVSTAIPFADSGPCQFKVNHPMECQ